ncbi:MAG: hypothetical protein WCY88_02055 [Spongiibacteraceae bacterium]
MFIEVKKNPQIYVQHKDMDSQYLAPVTSNFRINLGFIAEISTYSIKEVKTKKTLDGLDFEVPANTRVIHLEMSYTHSTHTAAVGTNNEHTVNERYFYKLVFLPEAQDEYLRIRNILDRQTLS